MGRLTTNKDTADMGMYELAHNCCYIEDRKARYRDFCTDKDARELARDLMVRYGIWEIKEINGELTPVDKELIDNDLFDEAMLENLAFDPEKIEGLIALFYRNLWAMAELRETLKTYEDTGLTPEQAMTAKKIAVSSLRYAIQQNELSMKRCDDSIMKHSIEQATDDLRAELQKLEAPDDGYKKTNAERIRAMSNEELAEFLSNIKKDGLYGGAGYPVTCVVWEEWLQEEARENEHDGF